MGFSLVKTDVNFDKLPDSIKAVHSFWLDLYDRCPIAAIFIIVVIPFIVLYAIYTYGTIRRQERSTDEAVKEIYKKHKPRKRRRK